MKNKIKYVLSAVLLLFFVIFALLAPQVADLWYDGQTMGQQSRETMDYQPCEITPYHSFADQMEAIAVQIAMDASPFSIQLKEREDAPSDGELTSIANRELQQLYKEGILPREAKIEELSFRQFNQLYAVPVEKEAAALQDICFWTLSADTEWGNIYFCLDQNYHKIYGLVFAVYVEKSAPDIESWMDKQKADKYYSMTSAWCRYWELEEATVENPIYEEKDHVTYTDAYGEENDYRVTLSGENGFTVWNRVVNPLMYKEQGAWQLLTGLGVLLDVM